MAAISNKYGKYTKINIVNRCWRKAYILPVSWNKYTNNQVGSKSLLAHKNQVSNEE